MVRPLLIRMASAIGLLSLAFLAVSLDPFFAAGPTSGASFFGMAPAGAVDRSFKGDRLPVSESAAPYTPDWSAEFGALTSMRLRAQMPVGCDPAFSPISSPLLARVYRRCVT